MTAAWSRLASTSGKHSRDGEALRGMRDGDDIIAYCRCSTCKQDAEGQGPGLVWVWEDRKWIRGWPIGTTD